MERSLVKRRYRLFSQRICLVFLHREEGPGSGLGRLLIRNRLSIVRAKIVDQKDVIVVVSFFCDVAL